MNKNLNLREYITIPWIKFLLWTILIIAGIVLIGFIANFLTGLVFHFN